MKSESKGRGYPSIMRLLSHNHDAFGFVVTVGRCEDDKDEDRPKKCE